MKDILMASEGLYMKQKASMAEVVTAGACEKGNKYKLYDQTTGKEMYKAKEESNCCARQLCAPGHSATLRIKEDDGPVAYTAYKPFKCVKCCACLPICQQEIQVYRGDYDPENPDGAELLGSAMAPTCGGGLTPKLVIKDGAGAPTGTMSGPTCCIGSCCATKFDYKKEGEEEASGGVQKVVKSSAKGAAMELFSDADNFGLEFNSSMTEEQRATMIGVMLLLDFWFFEDDGNCDLAHCTVKLFDWYCCGCLVPCKLSCDNSSGGGD